MQEAGTVDGFFEYGYSQHANADDLIEFRKIFNRKSLIAHFHKGEDRLSFEHRYYMEDGSQ